MKKFYLLKVLFVIYSSIAYSINIDSTAGIEDRFPLAISKQMILIITKSWEDTSGTLIRYERVKLGEEWEKVGDKYWVSVGRKGLGWGSGLHGNVLGSGPAKQEGDGKSPAGVFALTGVFGYAPPDSAEWLHMPYIYVDSCTECVDDPDSKYYNTIVDNRKVIDKDWKSSEIMRLNDDQYKWGIFVAHNSMPRLKKGGSCIFIHIRKEGVATSGCSSMSEKNLVEILHWLNINSFPVLVQLTQSEYLKLKDKWNLP